MASPVLSAGRPWGGRVVSLYSIGMSHADESCDFGSRRDTFLLELLVLLLGRAVIAALVLVEISVELVPRFCGEG